MMKNLLTKKDILNIKNILYNQNIIFNSQVKYLYIQPYTNDIMSLITVLNEELELIYFFKINTEYKNLSINKYYSLIDFNIDL